MSSWIVHGLWMLPPQRIVGQKNLLSFCKGWSGVSHAKGATNGGIEPPFLSIKTIRTALSWTTSWSFHWVQNLPKQKGLFDCSFCLANPPLDLWSSGRWDKKSPYHSSLSLIQAWALCCVIPSPLPPLLLLAVFSVNIEINKAEMLNIFYQNLAHSSLT